MPNSLKIKITPVATRSWLIEQAAAGGGSFRVMLRGRTLWKNIEVLAVVEDTLITAEHDDAVGMIPFHAIDMLEIK
jgi:hypothetical protein